MQKTFPNTISKDEINTLPMVDCFGRFELVEDNSHAIKAIGLLSQEKILGFDTETRPSFSKNEFHHVSLLQLASKDCAYLFRLNKITFSKELQALLAQESIIKVGVAIHDDLKGLQKLAPFTPAGFIDLSKMVQSGSNNSVGLRTLVAIYLGLRLSKGAKVTNWERSPLTEAQQKYAANDAFAGLMVYEKLLAYHQI